MLQPYSVLHDQYQINYVIDEQPDSVIYRAYDQCSGRRVLIAALNQPEAAALHDAESVASQITTIQVEGLLALHDHFVEGLTCYIVIDDPQGQDLDRVAFSYQGSEGMEARLTITEAAALQQAERLLRVLEVLHVSQPALFLGEVRSTDIWATEDGTLSLAPFALIRTIGTDLSAYCAPELQDLDTEPAAPGDIYALGAVLYRLLTGWPPPTAAQRTAGTPLNPPRTINPDISPLAEQVVLRALDVQPGTRYQRAQEMRQALAIVRLMRDRWPGLGVSPYPPLSIAEVTPAAGDTSTLATIASTAEPAGNNEKTALAPTASTPAAPQRLHPCLVMTISFLGFLSVIICVVGGLLLTEEGQAFVRDVLTRGTGASSSQTTPQPDVPPPTSTPMPATTATVPITDNPRLLSSATITQIDGMGVIEQDEVGPTLYAPDGQRMAVGVGKNVLIQSSAELSSTSPLSTPLHILIGHTGKVTSLAFTQLITDTGTGPLLLASGSINDEKVRVWDVQSGQPVWELAGHTGWIRSLAASPDGTLIASGSTDDTIKLWNMQSGELVHTLIGHTNLLGNVAFSPDGSLLASASRDGTVRLWDVASGTEVARSDLPQPFYQSPDDQSTGQPYWMTGLAFSPDGSLLATGSSDSRVRLFDVATGTLLDTLRGHTNWLVIRGIAFSPDGTSLASVSLDGTLQIWNMPTGQLRQTMQHQGFQVLGLAWHPNSTIITSSSSDAGDVWVWNAQTGEMLQRLSVGQGWMTTLDYSSDSRVLGMASVNGVMRMHSLVDSEHITFTNAISSSQSMAFLSETRLVAATQALTSNLVLLDLEKRPGQQPQILEGLDDAQALNVTVSPDHTLIAAGTPDGSVVLWDVQTRRQLRVLEGLPGIISALNFSSDNRYLVASSTRERGNRTVSHTGVWEVERGDVKHILQGHNTPVTGVAVQQGGTILATLSSDLIQLWDLKSGNPLTSITLDNERSQFRSVAFSADGTLLAAGDSNGTISFWNSDSGSEPLHTIGVSSGVLALAFSPDGEHLAVSLQEGGIGKLGIPENSQP